MFRLVKEIDPTDKSTTTFDFSHVQARTEVDTTADHLSPPLRTGRPNWLAYCSGQGRKWIPVLVILKHSRPTVSPIEMGSSKLTYILFTVQASGGSGCYIWPFFSPNRMWSSQLTCVPFRARRKWILQLTTFLTHQNGIVRTDLCTVLFRPVAEVDATADHLPHPPEWNHPRGTQPLEEECRQEVPGRRGRKAWLFMY